MTTIFAVLYLWIFNFLSENETVIRDYISI